MNRKRWIYAGLLVVAAGAFAVDRLFLGEPKAAEAEPIGPRRPRPQPTASGKTVAGKPMVSDPSLIWLEQLTERRAARDVFSPSTDWLASEKKASAKEREAQLGPQPGSAEAFLAGHHLQATSVMPRGGMAVVDAKCLNVGETLDGFKLVRVWPERAVFRRSRETVTLTLPTPPEGSGPRSPVHAALTESSEKPKDPKPPSASPWEALGRLLGRRSSR